MAVIEYWIQLENRPWDASPHNIDRITGLDMKETTGNDPVDVTITSPGTGVVKTRKMYNPLRDSDGNVIDALILRAYKAPILADQSDAWTVPDDRKVNAWDSNEPDPTDNGTMGTIPGRVIECNVGDSVKVHFRNMDNRSTLGLKKVCINLPFIGEFCFNVPSPIPFAIEKRTHSLHPHGFVFAPTSDGAYPLSPPDPTQPVAGGLGLGPDETALWATVPGFSGLLKKGDRVPPGGTFIYSWNTIGWPTTAGVWLLHDHSICDMENVNLGAIAHIVIHNPADTEQEVDIRDPNDPTALDPEFLPGGSPNGDPRVFQFFPFPPLPEGFPFREILALPHDLEGLGAHDQIPHEHKKLVKQESEHGASLPILERSIRRGDLLFQLDKKLRVFEGFFLRHYRTPPTKALYLQLFHTLTGTSGMLINGRSYLGNTPTMVAGPNTRMRFGVVGMGNDFHTFHIHGHRWIIPGPDGNTVGAIQGSPLITAVSQFEDTKIFGPANSFVFTIDEGSGFMRASPPIGEWHMHCHVLSHMMMGMMGSLLIVNGGELALALPVGVPCEMHEMGDDGGNGGGDAPMTATVKSTGSCTWNDDASGTPETTIMVSGTVTWEEAGCGGHTVISSGAPAFADLNALPGNRTFNVAGDYKYFCDIHGGDPVAKTGMWGIVHVVP
jgi:FtsP/CotA-like multicopper oxidase with cupredoxin domain/plastocyanin